MNAGDWIALAGALGALVAAAVAVITAVNGREDARRSAAAAEKSQKETERQVEISGRIADVADKTFGASSQPIIVSDAIPDPPFEYLHEALDERNKWTRAQFAVSIQYPIRNVGVGPAMIVSVKMTATTGESDGTTTTYDAISSVAVMAPTETGLMKLVVPTTHMESLGLPESLERGERLTAEISYTSIGAERRYLTRFVLKPRTHTALKPHPPGTTRDFGLDTTQIYDCNEQGDVKGPPVASSKLPDPDGSPQN